MIEKFRKTETRDDQIDAITAKGYTVKTISSYYCKVYADGNEVGPCGDPGAFTHRIAEAAGLPTR